MNEIDAKIAELSSAFFDLPLVKEYFNAVDLINGDHALIALSDEVKKLQRLMTLNMNKPSYNQYKSEYEMKLNAYNSHPYIVNYQYLKVEVEDLLTQMKVIIEDK